MAPKSTTPKKRLMIVNRAPADNGKTSALRELGKQLRKEGAKCLYEEMINNQEDVIWILLYKDTVIGLSTIGDTTPQIREAYATVNKWFKENPGSCDFRIKSGVESSRVADIFITAAHPRIEFNRLLQEIADHGSYERHFSTHDFLPDNEELWQKSYHDYAEKIIKNINQFINAVE